MHKAVNDGLPYQRAIFVMLRGVIAMAIIHEDRDGAVTLLEKAAHMARTGAFGDRASAIADSEELEAKFKDQPEYRRLRRREQKKS